MLQLKILLALAFALAGVAKLAGVRPLAEQFREFGLPRPIMLLVGLLELAGAAGLFVDRLTIWAALGLAGLMVGAVGNHVKAKHGLSKTAPSLLLLILTSILAAWLG